jgi:hypothetical protein
MNTEIRTSPEWITELKDNQIFVFGSNTEGIHGGGAARMAMKFGAIYGEPNGPQGRSYAIVTKDLNKGMRSVPLSDIEAQIKNLLSYAARHPHLEILVTKIGCELAGFEVEEIATLFKSKTIPNNVLLPAEFIKYL